MKNNVIKSVILLLASFLSFNIQAQERSKCSEDAVYKCAHKFDSEGTSKYLRHFEHTPEEAKNYFSVSLKKNSIYRFYVCTPNSAGKKTAELLLLDSEQNEIDRTALKMPFIDFECKESGQYFLKISHDKDAKSCAVLMVMWLDFIE